VSASEKVTVNFKVVVENVNDVMEDPRITNPSDGDKFLANQSFLLSVFCSDPDTQHGQVLNFTWTSNASGLLGYGPSLTVRLLEPGVHVLTVTVRDGEFEKIAAIGIIIEEVDDGPPPNGPDGDDGKGFPTGLLMAVLVILGVVGMSVFFVVSKARREREEAEEEAAFAAEEERVKALEKARMTVKRAADQLEVERGTVDISSKEGGVETEALEEVELTSLGVPDTTLSMEAKKTTAPSAEVKALFDDMEKKEPAMSDEEIEAMRLDNLKRKYQNAIGRLPYGIPSEELKDMDWVELAAALATGEKKTLPDGMEITEIEGRWYYSDDKDSSTFLKEHGAKPKAPAKKAKVTTDKEDLLAKLEERFILGEISEKAYEELKKKYEG
jgi:uncharacterized membrane protein